MAHFKAKYRPLGGENDMLDRYPYTSTQAWGMPEGDLYPLLNYYLLACEVEGKSPATLKTYFNFIAMFLRSLNVSGIAQVTPEGSLKRQMREPPGYITLLFL